MLVDKTTLYDLGILHNSEEQSVFPYLNFTKTNGGRQYLKQLLLQPLSNVDQINDRQQTLQALMQLQKGWPPSITNGTLMVVEKFFETAVSPYPGNPQWLNTSIYRYLQRTDYSITKYSVEHIVKFLQGCKILANLFQPYASIHQIHDWITQIDLVMNHHWFKPVVDIALKDITPVLTIQFASIFKAHGKEALRKLMHLYSEIDAFLSLAIACEKHQFCFPTFLSPSNSPVFEAEALYHLQLNSPIAYQVQLMPNNHFMFLTGANMGGKSTFIKAVGLATYFAHLGMAVPAQKMQLSFFDGLQSNIHINDNLAKGESFFYNEVQRVKKTILQVTDGKKWLVLIDELFKGTNVQDAMKCSTAVIEGLRKINTALFIVSTHLYEIGEALQQYNDIQFRYFETSVINNQLVFSYHLKEGISSHRLGYLILQQEGVEKLLQNL